MTNKTDAAARMKDAGACLQRAQKNLSEGDYVVAIQQAQLGIELSAKIIIFFFSEPKWTHAPGEQLKKIIGEHEDEIAEKFGVDMIGDLFQLAEDADFAAPWHAKATYGEEEEDGFIPAVDICTKEIAADLTERCQGAFDTAKRFFAGAGGE